MKKKVNKRNSRINYNMQVAYVFVTSMSSTFKLATMILPQLENGNHGAQVAGMMFFDDNILFLKKGSGKRKSFL